MLLTKLSVKRYRTLEDIEIQFDSHYTAVSGRNNSGKSNVLRVLRSVLAAYSLRYREVESIDFEEDRTRWLKNDDPIEIEYTLALDKSLDPGLTRFLENQAKAKISQGGFLVTIKSAIHRADQEFEVILPTNKRLTGILARETAEKLKSTQSAFFHNPLEEDHILYYARGKFRAAHEPNFGPAERQQLAKAEAAVRAKLKKLAKAQKQDVSELLGRLEDKIDIEFTIPEYAYSRGASFSINLKDKNVEVPLPDWGAGTQNKTRILMSLLAASKIRNESQDEGRITPIVFIEEPESFLHPESQAIFGKTLRRLAQELEVQIITTTHSPYMLCQENPRSNVLLARLDRRNSTPRTVNVDIDETSWMEPFGRVLGLDSAEFKPWHDIFSTHNSSIILVEGEIDKRYFEHLRTLGGDLAIPPDWEVLPYNGKDALSNSILLKFFLSKFAKVFITFDLDAAQDVEPALRRVGLEKNRHYCHIGLAGAGRGCIEALVPERIQKAVNSENADLVMAMAMSNGTDRKSARSMWKSKMIEAFEAERHYDQSELEQFRLLVKRIKSCMPNNQNNRTEG